MTCRIRHIRTIFVIALLTLCFSAPQEATALPTAGRLTDTMGNMEQDYIYTPSEFFPQQEMKNYVQKIIQLSYLDYEEALKRNDYVTALSVTSSIIATIEQGSIRPFNYARYYKQRAEMLQALHHDAEAAEAYTTAINLQDSLLQCEQNRTIRDMQIENELDQFILDQKLAMMHTHRNFLKALLSMLIVLAIIVGIIYTANQHTRQLKRKLQRQIGRAGESDRKKTEFINSLVHEVRTPLNSITGFSELLCTEDPTAETYAQYCEIIRNCRRQLRYLFDDILEVAVLENRQEVLPTSEFDLCALCNTHMRVARVLYAKSGVEYRTELPETPILIQSHKRYLGLLLSALLNNASKFTQEGVIGISCRRMHNHQIAIRIWDTGCGIPANLHEEVFESFTKVDTFSQGNGLGLYLCRLIVRHLGGKIQIDPLYSKGTAMVVTLPER